MVETAQEFFWGVELTKDKPTFTWTFEEEDEDNDYMIHTLFLKNAVLGASAVKGERNLVQIETKNFEKEDLNQPLLSLTLGQADMCNLDISFGNEVKAVFRLVEGTGPVSLGGQQLVEFPPDDDELNSQDESALEDTMESELTEEDMSPKKSKKRKAGAAGDKKSKKGKMDESMSSADDSVDDEEDDEEDEDDDDEEDMEDEEESSPEKGKKKKGSKDQKGKKAGPKTTKVSPKKAAKKTTKKGKK